MPCAVVLFISKPRFFVGRINNGILFINDQALEKLKLKEGQRIRVQFRLRSKWMVVELASFEGDPLTRIVRMTTKDAKFFGLKSGKKYFAVSYPRNRKLRLVGTISV